MAKTEHLGLRLDQQEKAALEAAAEADERSMSALARMIIVEWLRKHGWMQ